MIIYILFLLLILFLGIIPKVKLRFVLTALSFVLLFSLRDVSVGIDITSYVTKFYQISRTAWGGLFSEGTAFRYFEPGFVVFDKLLSYITDNQQVYLAICAIVIYLPLLVFYNKKGPYYSRYVYYYVCLPSFFICLSGIRQAMAVSISLIAYEFYHQRKYLWAIILYLLSISIHTVSIIAIVMIVSDKVKIKKKDFWKILVAIGFIFALKFTIVENALSYVSLYVSKVSSYTVENNNSYGLFALYFILLVFVFVFSSEKLESDADFLRNRNMIVLLTMFQSLASTQSNIGRTTYFFIPFIPLVFTDVIENGIIQYANYKSKLIMNSICYVVYSLLFIYMMGAAEQLNLIPYVFFWNR